MTEKMDSKSHSLLIFISLSSLLLIFSSSSFVEATCKPRYLTYPIPSSFSSSHSNHILTSPSPSSPPPKQASTSSQSPPPPPPKPSSSPPSPPTPTPSPPPPTPKSSPPPPAPTPSPPSKTQPAESISLFSPTPTTSSPPPKTILPFIPSVISVAGGINAAIKNICSKTDNVDLCLSSIAPFIVPGKTDPVSVFGMQLKAVNLHAQTALTAATKIFQNPGTPSTVRSCIEDCKDNYEDAIDNLKSAADALTRRDFATVDSMLSAAMSDFGTCEDGFSDFPGLVSPMSAADDLLHKMTSNLLALSSVCKSP